MHKEKKWEGQRLDASQIISYLLNLVQKPKYKSASKCGYSQEIV